MTVGSIELLVGAYILILKNKDVIFLLTEDNVLIF